MGVPVNFGDRRKEAEKAGLLGSGDYLKLKEGNNRLRLLTECLPHTSLFQGRKNFKWLCYVVDRVDGKAKAFFMPHTIYKQIEALQISEDYAFAEVPMPYDLTVSATGAGTKEAKYTVIPARKETAVTAEEYQELAKLKPLAELRDALKAKNEKSDAERVPDGPPPDHDGPLTDEDIPF